MKIIYENPIHLIAEDGMILTDGESFSTDVWLGIHDSPENWHEVEDIRKEDSDE